MRKLCAEPHCQNVKPCPVHNTGWSRWKQANPHAAAEYHGDWPKLRARVLREEPRCRLCGAPATDVDHILPRARGGRAVRSNLRALCRACHRRVTGAMRRGGGGGGRS